MNHQITKDDVVPTMSKARILLAASHGKDENKTLHWWPAESLFLVTIDGKEHQGTMFIDKAITLYNGGQINV